MHGQLILHLNDAWYRVEGDRLVACDAFPRLDMPTTVISDFSGAHTDVIAIEGRASYAPMLIEKRVREQGLVDGQGRVMVHRLLRSGGGFRALYTAVAIARWQQLMEWAERQPAECLVVALQTLLCRLAAASKRRAVVFRHEREFLFLQLARQELRYERGFAYGTGAADWIDGAEALGRSVKAGLADQAHATDPKGVDWFCSWSSEAAEESLLVERFAATSGLDSRLGGQKQLHRGAGASESSVLPRLRDMVRGGDGLNSGLARTSGVLQQSMPLASAAMLAAAAVLGGLAWSAERQAQGLAAEVGRAQATLQSQQRQLAGLKRQAVLPAEFKPVSEFVATVVRARRGTDPVHLLAAMRDAAAGHVRVLRVAIDRDKEGAEVVRVEGLVPGDSLDTRGLAAFVAALEEQGFLAKPVAGSGARSMPGMFAYQLTPVVQASGEGNRT